MRSASAPASTQAPALRQVQTVRRNGRYLTVIRPDGHAGPMLCLPEHLNFPVELGERLLLDRPVPSLSAVRELLSTLDYTDRRLRHGHASTASLSHLRALVDAQTGLRSVDRLLGNNWIREAPELSVQQFLRWADTAAHALRADLSAEQQAIGQHHTQLHAAMRQLAVPIPSRLLGPKVRDRHHVQWAFGALRRVMLDSGPIRSRAAAAAVLRERTELDIARRRAVLEAIWPQLHTLPGHARQTVTLLVRPTEMNFEPVAHLLQHYPQAPQTPRIHLALTDGSALVHTPMYAWHALRHTDNRARVRRHLLITRTALDSDALQLLAAELAPHLLHDRRMRQHVAQIRPLLGALTSTAMAA